MIKVPLRVLVGKKYISINLNIYRNCHYQILNKAKIAFKDLVKEQLVGLKLVAPVTIEYTYYPRDKRLSDLGNVLSIQSKFFEDALVELKCLPDDNYTQIDKIIYSFGSIDKEDPRVEINIRNSNAI